MSDSKTSTFSTGAPKIKSLGTLEFSEEGILFIGDNIAGAIHAFDLSAESTATDKFEINAYGIDAQIAAILGTEQAKVRINDIAVHPKSGEVYISVNRGLGIDAQAALVKMDAANQIHAIDLSTLEFTTQMLSNIPDNNRRVALRGTAGSPPTEKEIAKSKQSLRVLTIINMAYHKGELFVAGISNEEFCSVLRRLPYPFNGEASINNIEMYHVAHDNYESRAPIRSMVVKTIDGIDQLVAAYTCSPLVLIPLNELIDNQRVKARTVGDMGNGQPIDMVPYNVRGEEMLFVTNNSRSPMVIPVSGLQDAKVLTDKNMARGSKLDMHPEMPIGPVGKPMMFSGASLRIDLLNENQFVSLNRDTESGSLDLETVGTQFPFKMHSIIGAVDIPV